MSRNTNPRFNQKLGIFLHVEKSMREIAKHLNLTDTQVYHEGIFSYSMKNAGRLSEQEFIILSQENRSQIKELQDRTALIERLAFDARVKAETVSRKKTTVLKDERGRETVAVYAE